MKYVEDLKCFVDNGTFLEMVPKCSQENFHLLYDK